jgi:hypothetical protein
VCDDQCGARGLYTRHDFGWLGAAVLAVRCRLRMPADHEFGRDDSVFGWHVFGG